MKFPYRFFIFLLSVCCFVLLGQLLKLQVLEQTSYDRLAKQNIGRTLRVEAARGAILDRNGELLAKSRPVFSVLLFPSQVKDLAEVIPVLSRVLGQSEYRLRQMFRADRPVPEPVLLRKELSLARVMPLAEQPLLPGVVLKVGSVREYPQKTLAAHLLGYVGEVSQEELSQPGSPYVLGETVGKVGMEKEYDAALRGTAGFARVQMAPLHAALQPFQVWQEVEATPGETLTLSIDSKLQAVVEQSLWPYPGGVVAVDAKRGEVLALASVPRFNPNWFTEPLSPRTWGALQQMNHPFLNRAVTAYPPGSTFKVIVAGVVLEEGLVKPGETFYCPGYFKLGNRIARCWKHSGHGRVDLKEAIVWSCDVAFYQMALRLGPEKIAKYAKACGLGEVTGIDLPGELPGHIPAPAWKERRYGDVWYQGDTINFGIGQGYVQATPLQMALLYRAIAMEGKWQSPRVLRTVTEQVAGKKQEPATSRALPFQKKTLDFLKDALEAVVKRGTGRAASVYGFPAAGKTGTAEDPPRRPHAWFVCFAPVENPELVLSVFVEQGEHGDRVAARIAGQILRWWHTHRHEKKMAKAKRFR